MFKDYFKSFIEEFIEFINVRTLGTKIIEFKEIYVAKSNDIEIVKCVLTDVGYVSLTSIMFALGRFILDKKLFSADDNVITFGETKKGCINITSNCVNVSYFPGEFSIAVVNNDWKALGMSDDVSIISSIDNKM